MVNPITLPHFVSLAVPVALLPPGLFPGESGKVTLQLWYARRDWANAEWKLKMPLLGPGAAAFWASELSAYMTGILLFVGLQRALPKLTPDDAHDLIPFEGSEEIETAVMEAVKAAFPKPQSEPQQEESGDASPLATTSGGSGPGPSPDSTSG